ncbi:hypothetical protein SteCoe_32958 [Stentor coeruleus]|uniref:Uncharacterized protein n=1 Tax=Stentor coeruleus TaxID=5963 RepID=A0A1R2AXU8_9CILI|nr:hypothetical protein SteCoe_32958 [Stentor coeruleus]
MSIAILDMISDYVAIDFLPAERSILMICSETCLIPSSLKCEHMPEVDIDTLLKGGIYFIRIASDLQKGIIIGSLYSKHRSNYINSQLLIKIYSPRKDIFSNFVLQGTFEILSIPVADLPIRPNPPPAPNQVPDSSTFDGIYMESLSKYSKAILFEKTIRANKIKSAKAQLRNVVDGTIISYRKKFSRNIDFDSDEVVDAIFADFERLGIIINGYTLEYNDSLIDAYFGFSRTMTYIPAHKIQNDYVPSLPTYPSIESPFKYTIESNDSGFPLYNERNFEPCIFQAQPTPGNPFDQNYTMPKPQIRQPEQNFGIPITKPNPHTSLENYIHICSDYAIEKIMVELDSITNILILFRSTSRIIREYFEANKTDVNDDIKKKIVDSCIKIVLDLFFIPETSLSNEQIVADLFKNGKIVLKKRD